MKFAIKHQTEYQYQEPIELHPHIFYLRPRTDGFHTLLDFGIKITPEPKIYTTNIDVYGNIAIEVAFEGKHDTLLIQSHSSVITLRENPYDYLIKPDIQTLPIRYEPFRHGLLAPFYEHREVGEAVRKYSHALANETNNETLVFLSTLCKRIYNEFEVFSRPDGEAWPAIQTFGEKRGSCRDLSVLFIVCCRLQGLAARFVSGYHEGDPKKEEKDLHAWAEVYLEGAGWRGYDPSTGLAVQDRHVAVASAITSKEVMPVIGSYQGEVESKLKFSVTMNKH